MKTHLRIGDLVHVTKKSLSYDISWSYIAMIVACYNNDNNDRLIAYAAMNETGVNTYATYDQIEKIA
jgi:hypothetical protein